MTRLLRNYDPLGMEAGAPRTILTRTRRSRLAIRRFRHEPAPGRVTAIGTKCRDGHVAVFQLRDKPAHEFLLDGHSTGAPLSPRGSLHFVDLGTAPVSMLTGSVDSLHIHIPGAALEDLVEDERAAHFSGLRTPVEWNTEDAVLQRMQPMLLAALDEPGGAGSLFMDHLMLALASHFAAAYGGASRRVRLTGGLAPWQCRRAKELLAANLHKEVPLLEVADACGLSLAHFSRAFKASVGTPPHGWLQARRLDRARDLLRDGSLPLAGIATACGFGDQSHFTRIFRRSTGMTPGTWRRAHLT